MRAIRASEIVVALLTATSLELRTEYLASTYEDLGGTAEERLKLMGQVAGKLASIADAFRAQEIFAEFVDDWIRSMIEDES